MMNWQKVAYSALFSAALILVGGCGIFDTDDPTPAGAGKHVKAPEGEPGPVGDLNFNNDPLPDEPTKFGGGADENSLGYAAFSDLRPVQGPNFPIIYFGYDRSTIGSAERPKLEKIASYLKQYPQLYLIIEGHCDERGTLEYNRALGERRAISVKQFMESQGVAADRIRTISYGEEKLAVPSDHAKNRRAILIPAEKM